MPIVSAECPEVVLELERFLLGAGEVLRGTDDRAEGDSRQRLLHVGVLIQNGRDVWFELRAETRASAPARVFFAIRFVAEDGLEPGCAAALVIAGVPFAYAGREARGGSVAADQVSTPRAARAADPDELEPGAGEQSARHPA
jgi:hypothetical protein